MAKLNERMAGHPMADDPAEGAVAITGSAQTLATSGRGLLITSSGNITFTMQDGSSVTWNTVPVGIYWLTCKAITSSTASGYVLL